MLAKKSMKAYSRAIGLNAKVVKLVEFLDKYTDDLAQFELGDLRNMLALAKACKNYIPELQRLTDETTDIPLHIDVDILIDELEAHIEFLSPRA